MLSDVAGMPIGQYRHVLILVQAASSGSCSFYLA